MKRGELSRAKAALRLIQAKLKESASALADLAAFADAVDNSTESFNVIVVERLSEDQHGATLCFGPFSSEDEASCFIERRLDTLEPHQTMWTVRVMSP